MSAFSLMANILGHSVSSSTRNKALVKFQLQKRFLFKTGFISAKKNVSGRHLHFEKPLEVSDAMVWTECCGIQAVF